MPSVSEIRQCLSTVEEPELHRDLVSLNMVKALSIEGSLVKITIELTTPACPLKDELKKRIQNALLKCEGVHSVEVNFTARVAAARPVSAKAPIEGVKNIIAVYACKGGVGKSTLAVNLAVALSVRGAKTGLLDADIHGPNVPLMMGARGPAAVSDQNKISPISAHNVKTMSLAYVMNESTPKIWRGPMVHGAVQQLLRDTEWGELDYLVVDLPPGTGDAQLTIIQSVPLAGVVFVSTPQVVSLLDGAKGIQMFQKLKAPMLGLVENMAGFSCPHCGEVTDIFSRGGGEKEAREYEIPFLGSVPIDPLLVQGGDNGTPIVLSHPSSVAAQSLFKIAERVAANLSVHHYQEAGKEILEIQ